MELNVKPEDVIELAAQKLADEIGSESDIYDRARIIIQERVVKMVEGQLKANVDEFLRNELQKIADAEFERVTEFGEPTGKKVTIRSMLSERSKNFWNERVDSEGKPSGSYGGKPRGEWFTQRFLQCEFEAAVKNNAKEVVAAFAEHLKVAGCKIVTEQITKLVNVK